MRRINELSPIFLAALKAEIAERSSDLERMAKDIAVTVELDDRRNIVGVECVTCRLLIGNSIWRNYLCDKAISTNVGALLSL